LIFRIHRSATPDAIVFALSGDMDREHVAGLHELLENEADRRITVDLHDVTLVDRPGVQFLADAEATGIRIVNAPNYVRTWIVAEKDRNARATQEPDAPLERGV